MASQCLGRNRDDTPCSAWVQPGRSYCQWHDPALAEQRREWSRKGGANRSNRARARKELADDSLTLRDAGAILGRLLRNLESDDPKPGVVTAAAAAVRALAALEEVTTLADAIADLEARLGVESA